MTEKKRENKERWEKAKEVGKAVLTFGVPILVGIAQNVLTKQGTTAANSWIDNHKK